MTPEVDGFIPNMFKSRNNKHGSYNKPIDDNWAQIQTRIMYTMGLLSHMWYTLDQVRLGYAETPDLNDLLDMV